MMTSERNQKKTRKLRKSHTISISDLSEFEYPTIKGITSKIPLFSHTSPSHSHPTTTLRRAASLRLRGAKSNLAAYYGPQSSYHTTSTPILVMVSLNGTLAEEMPKIISLADATNGSCNLKIEPNRRTPPATRRHSTVVKTAEPGSPSRQDDPFGESSAKSSIPSAKRSGSPKSESQNGVSSCKANGGGCSPIAAGRTEGTGSKRGDTNKMSLHLNGLTTVTNSHGPIKASPGGGGGITPTSRTPTSTTPKASAVRTPKTPIGPKTPLSTVPETRTTPKTPPVTPDSPAAYFDEDLDSLYSFGSTTSGRSTMSCDHPYVARNGTTFSGRKMKYVVHCSSYAGQIGQDYLTPTQRAQRHIRRLKELLSVARQDLEQKDTEILRLTREVVELRLFKASLSSPEDRSNSSDAVTVREAELKTSQDVSPIVDMVDEGLTKSSPRHILHGHHHHSGHHLLCNSEMQSSFADSGHFEDMTTSSVHSKDSYVHTHDQACGSDEGSSYEEQRQELIRLYEKRIEELIQTQDAATNCLKNTHNDRVEGLLHKLSECNNRYADIVPDYEQAKERIRELEKQLGDLQRKLQEHEEKQNKMYLHMYQKGQEAERIARADQAIELAHRAPNKVSITELLHQLQSTQDELENIRAAECRSECGSNQALLTAKEAISLWVLGARKTIYRRLLDAQKNKTHVDPEVTLQFLKSAVYYFLTDKENSHGHLNAIESILEFTEQEKTNISKARQAK